ncbi:MAG: hypothetical protein E6G66_08210 [Actinobacteria bacterium]|nr:MAG: hypothetical protein E6G66_08210 [Actinomycetota bacterium]
MAEPVGASLLTEERARVLASGYKSRPFWGGITPRWVLRYLRAHDAFVSVDGGSYRVNRVTESYLDVQTSVAGDTSVLPQENLHVAHGHGEGTDLGESFALYDPDPQQIWIRSIQTVLKVHTRVPTLYSAQHNQLEQQVRLAAEYLYETQENLLFSHPEYGILTNVAPSYRVEGAPEPTLDLLDHLLSLCWKEPDLFVMHPETLEALRARATRQSVRLETIEKCGGRLFSSWRGVPMFPSNKLFLTPKAKKSDAAASGYETLPRAPGESTTQIALLRVGEEKQGVVGLFAAKNPGTERFPFISVDPMGISDDSVASYLLSMFVAAATLAPDAVASAEVTV